jgi:hypothetical protein
MNLLRPTLHIISHIRDIVKLVAMRGNGLSRRNSSQTRPRRSARCAQRLALFGGQCLLCHDSLWWRKRGIVEPPPHPPTVRLSAHDEACCAGRMLSPPLRDCTLSSTDVVICQVEIPRQEGKSGKSVNRRTEAERSQSVFARVRWRIEGSCAVGWSYSWKTSGEALTPVSRLGVPHFTLRRRVCQGQPALSCPPRSSVTAAGRWSWSRSG